MSVWRVRAGTVSPQVGVAGRRLQEGLWFPIKLPSSAAPHSCSACGAAAGD